MFLSRVSVHGDAGRGTAVIPPEGLCPSCAWTPGAPEAGSAAPFSEGTLFRGVAQRPAWPWRPLPAPSSPRCSRGRGDGRERP